MHEYDIEQIFQQKALHPQSDQYPAMQLLMEYVFLFSENQDYQLLFGRGGIFYN